MVKGMVEGREQMSQILRVKSQHEWKMHSRKRNHHSKGPGETKNLACLRNHQI